LPKIKLFYILCIKYLDLAIITGACLGKELKQATVTFDHSYLIYEREIKEINIKK